MYTSATSTFIQPHAYFTYFTYGSLEPTIPDFTPNSKCVTYIYCSSLLRLPQLHLSSIRWSVLSSIWSHIISILVRFPFVLTTAAVVVDLLPQQPVLKVQRHPQNSQQGPSQESWNNICSCLFKSFKQGKYIQWKIHLGPNIQIRNLYCFMYRQGVLRNYNATKKLMTNIHDDWLIKDYRHRTTYSRVPL